MQETFFSWLESIGKLDRYEALLDISEEYCNPSSVYASIELDKIKTRYKEETFRLNKIKKLKYNIDNKCQLKKEI